MWGPRSIAKLVSIAPITMVYGTYNYGYWGFCSPTNITRGPHIAAMVNLVLPWCCSMGPWYHLGFKGHLPFRLSWFSPIGIAISAWWWLEHEFYDFPYIGNTNPNWRTPSFFRGLGWNHQPDVVGFILPLFSDTPNSFFLPSMTIHDIMMRFSKTLVVYWLMLASP